MNKEHRSILLLKEAAESAASINSQKVQDPYFIAFHSLIKDDIPTTIEYLPPFSVIFPESSLLSNAIRAGYPKTPYSHQKSTPISESEKESCEDDNSDCIWAFAITSQNSVHAVEKALQMQSDPDIQKAWLEIPVYCLTGATLMSVEKIGFKYINRSTLPSKCNEIPGVSSPISFDNSAQLVDFLVSMEWPKSSNCRDGKGPHPTLWFLAGEMRMKTISEKLKENGKPYQEVEVYRTGPKSGFEDDLYNKLKWLSMKSSSMNTTERVKKTIWLVGFSPRGVDLAIPGLIRFLNESDIQENQICESPLKFQIEIRWATIGSTTGKRVQEHLDVILTQQCSTLHSEVAIAKTPKPNALAEAILL